MKNFDSHTHLNRKNSLKSCTLDKFKNMDELLDGQKISLQFHPWHLPEKYNGLPEDFIETAKSEKIYAIGEIGLDRLKGPDFDVQKKYFIDLLDLANELKKPIVLHIVRSADEALHILKKYPELQIIWHGFRGRKELFEQIVKRNIFVSLHPSMLENQDFIGYIKTHKEYHSQIGFESDDNEIEIEELFRRFEEKTNE